MTLLLRDWAKFARRQQWFYNTRRFFGQPQITHAVSKSFSGRMRQDRIRTLCESPEKCAHLHFPGSFDCNGLRSHDCDSDFSKKHLQGKVKAGYGATFGQAGDVGFAKSVKEAHEDRGYFFGNFDLFDPDTEKRVLDGVIDGMVNVGIVRDPLKEACEKCHHVGRWYGRLHAGVRLPKKEIGFLTAMVAIDVIYKSTDSYLQTEFTGTMEGMLIRDCKKSG